MIISASRRTDIPAFYSKWFFNRIKEGFVLVRNPFNISQVSRISLEKNMVDCFVFWTKNPEKMLSDLDLIRDYPYYFQFTLNPYGSELERNVPDKAKVIDTFIRLSEKIGPKRVIWRYDPIIINKAFNVEKHEEGFGKLAGKLQKHASKCIISFVDYYKKTDKAFKANDIAELQEEEIKETAKKISLIAGAYGMKIETCAEKLDLSEYGIGHARCIDPVLIEEITGTLTDYKKDINQRKACGCISSVDIGTYNTCLHGCMYCYATYSKVSVDRNHADYDVNSPLLCSKLKTEDKILERRPVR
jgi:DNA repair photolyase